MSIGRKIKRAQEKKQYDRLVDAWRKEKRYQELMKKEGKPSAMKLGKRPTFAMWLANVRTQEARQEATPEIVQEHLDEIQDLEWKEE